MKYLALGLARIIASPLSLILIPVSLVQHFGGAEFDELWWPKFMDWWCQVKK